MDNAESYSDNDYPQEYLDVLGIAESIRNGNQPSLSYVIDTLEEAKIYQKDRFELVIPRTDVEFLNGNHNISQINIYYQQLHSLSQSAEILVKYAISRISDKERQAPKLKGEDGNRFLQTVFLYSHLLHHEETALRYMFLGALKSSDLEKAFELVDLRFQLIQKSTAFLEDNRVFPGKVFNETKHKFRFICHDLFDLTYSIFDHNNDNSDFQIDIWRSNLIINTLKVYSNVNLLRLEVLSKHMKSRDLPIMSHYHNAKRLTKFSSTILEHVYTHGLEDTLPNFAETLILTTQDYITKSLQVIFSDEDSNEISDLIMNHSTTKSQFTIILQGLHNQTQWIKFLKESEYPMDESEWIRGKKLYEYINTYYQRIIKTESKNIERVEEVMNRYMELVPKEQ